MRTWKKPRRCSTLRCTGMSVPDKAEEITPSSPHVAAERSLLALVSYKPAQTAHPFIRGLHAAGASRQRLVSPPHVRTPAHA
ncbi:hypothetical protein EVAR_66633_1 [Eumeta japonica]|uniref:Uncharacterized protein n=1 Tax=Eumeta variegata TaxID=151549 RepID=A0A4C1ZVA8_EUMVA|nr:hypothetical protein EVAR_66633_1 [Eumeta japonica]